MVIIDIANDRGHKKCEKMSESEKILEKLEELSVTFGSFESRLAKIENTSCNDASGLSKDHPKTEESATKFVGDNSVGQTATHHLQSSESTESSYTSFTEPSADVIQAKYKSIKDSLQRIRLPEGYKTDTALRGIGRQHIQQARVINASSDYAETLMKFILTLQEEAPLTAQDIDTCMTIVSAHIKYLQAEKGVCYVNAKFGDNVGSMFREFKSHSSVFSPGDIATLERVVQLASAHNNNRGSSQRGGRGRGYRGNQGYDGGYSRGVYRGHGNRYNWNRGGFQSRGGNRSGGDSWTDSENTVP